MQSPFTFFKINMACCLEIVEKEYNHLMELRDLMLAHHDEEKAGDRADYANQRAMGLEDLQTNEPPIIKVAMWKNLSANSGM